ncbi:MAG: septum formation protein Maf [Blastopirellula sp.]|nr:MAG: septum formation protein Maf [Blastopirellula sp.]
MQTQPIILASGSPRRYQLLTEAGFDVTVIRPDDAAEQLANSSGSPEQTVVNLAQAKAENVAQQVTSGIVLAGDTLAELDGQVLGKPRDRAHAKQILQTLRGREHRVLSGLCLWRRPEDRVLSQFDQTTVAMRDLSDEEIEEYLDSGLWQGKAGAFGLQDRLGWVQLVKGSESNVVGLPMELLAKMLEELNP